MSMAVLIRRMAEAGATPEAIALAVEAIEERDNAETGRKARRAEQKRRERDSRATVARHDGDMDATVAAKAPPSPPAASPPMINNSTPPSPPTSPPAKRPPAQAVSPVDALERVVGAELASALVEHRKRLRKPMTPFAAELLARSLERLSSPTQAARLMIERGWLTVRADWIVNTTGPPGGASTRNGKPSVQDFARLQDEQINGTIDDMFAEHGGDVRPHPARLLSSR